MYWRDAIEQIDRDSLIAELVPLRVIGAYSSIASKYFKRDLDRRLQLEIEGLQRSEHRIDVLQMKLLHQLYSRAWTGPTAANPDREVLIQAVRGMAPKVGKSSLVGKSDQELEDQLLDAYIEKIVSEYDKSSLTKEDLTERVRESVSESEWAELRALLGSEEVTAEGLGKLIKAAAVGSTGAVLANAAGFSLYTALTTAMASLAGAVGATLPFAAYTSATSALAFLTGPFIPIAIGGMALVQAISINRKVARPLIAHSLVSLRITGAAAAARSKELATAGSGGSALLAGDSGGRARLLSGERIENGGNALVMQDDGNLVLYRSGNAVWATDTEGRPGNYAILQSDGNFVLYDRDDAPLWSSGTGGRPSNYFRLELGPTGELSILEPILRRVWQGGPTG
jgi:hypothetical protein